MSDLTFVPIQPDDFRQKMHFLTKWNMQPLTREEMQSDTLHCPACGCVRYVMWKAKYPSIFVYTGKYCTCPQGEV